MKWIGGKRQLLGHLIPTFTEAQVGASYHEPFVGGGAVFFALRAQGRATCARLSDVNQELIGGYLAIRDGVDDVISHLRIHASLNDKEYYYRIRSQHPRSAPEAAARLIYLNKTCFNGLYRVNNSGVFNAPYGRHKNPTICDETNLRAVSAALATSSLEVASFETVLDHVHCNDVVYFDPPYIPVSVTASFTEYSAGGFGNCEQQRLADVFRELNKRGAQLVLSNSDTDEVRRLYSGFRIDQVFARRNVNTRADRRGPVAEVIVRNF
ncbi:DNA adenine methylase [Sorangium sp. So ce381]|uniref:DNA adenine methylase n=1 Tax=Sorangium sp. So ce381 TaxID=3133307 RepID=UPI003F5B2B05